MTLKLTLVSPVQMEKVRRQMEDGIRVGEEEVVTGKL
jgi:hypothetical protein